MFVLVVGGWDTGLRRFKRVGFFLRSVYLIRSTFSLFASRVCVEAVCVVGIGKLEMVQIGG